MSSGQLDVRVASSIELGAHGTVERIDGEGLELPAERARPVAQLAPVQRRQPQPPRLVRRRVAQDVAPAVELQRQHRGQLLVLARLAVQRHQRRNRVVVTRRQRQHALEGAHRRVAPFQRRAPQPSGAQPQLDLHLGRLARRLPLEEARALVEPLLAGKQRLELVPARAPT